ncbi:uncharacterized protein JN550_006732 [Neoarthrinium moseri]|uniref:uncharacterized protein n=1 Tax=Neoarthrinium moseri TaxID=1658444 RepID=UPI001FDD5EF0|nr:uncharacterized protein JN550_006732 [Neoarthrinium moseri]KAI1867925.1 hypothetical protein JN550_006732 [Neoarthrinium moseri]
MPRLPPALLRQAHSISPQLHALLPACRDLQSARSELRWIREHALSSSSGAGQPSNRHGNAAVARLVARRARGEPLQYVLGSQPFGALDLRCRPGVLIPRPETEAYVVHLASQLLRARKALGAAAADGRPLRVVDVCTGSGCIALLLYQLLHRGFPGAGSLRVLGLDVAPEAVALARENLERNVRRGALPATALEGGDVRFAQADLFSDGEWNSAVGQRGGEIAGVDVLVSNPPYISTQGFDRDTGRSVRNFEPRLALVPGAGLSQGTACAPEDVFYARLLKVSRVLRPRVMLFEVGDMEQARRVAQMATGLEQSEQWHVEIWRDDPDLDGNDGLREEVLNGRRIPVRGSGHGRSVFVHRVPELVT